MTRVHATLNSSTPVLTSTPPLAAAVQQCDRSADELQLDPYSGLPTPLACVDSTHSMLVHIGEQEHALLVRLLRRAISEVRYELSITQTDEVRALIKPREALLTGLLERVQTAADLSPGQRNDVAARLQTVSEKEKQWDC